MPVQTKRVARRARALPPSSAEPAPSTDRGGRVGAYTRIRVEAFVHLGGRVAQAPAAAPDGHRGQCDALLTAVDELAAEDAVAASLARLVEVVFAFADALVHRGGARSQRGREVEFVAALLAHRVARGCIDVQKVALVTLASIGTRCPDNGGRREGGARSTGLDSGCHIAVKALKTSAFVDARCPCGARGREAGAKGACD